MSLTRQAKGSLLVDRQTKVSDNFTRQVLHWIVYVFTSEQVYSNDGSKVIIYGGYEDYYDGQSLISVDFTKQLKIDTNFTRET